MEGNAIINALVKVMKNTTAKFEIKTDCITAISQVVEEATGQQIKQQPAVWHYES